MNVDKFKKLLAVPTCSGREEAMVAYLLNHFQSRPNVHAVADRHNNVLVIKGMTCQPLPCVAAHIDTVQPIWAEGVIQVVENGNVIHGSIYDGISAGLGADDKTGIQVCLELLDRFDNIALALFSGEEVGMQGAQKADADFFSKIGYMIEFDCPSRNMVSYSCGGTRLFEDDAPFISQALPVLQKHGSVLWQNHPYTDVKMVRQRFPISCLNLSSGYYNWHMPNEFIKISEVEMAVELGADLVRELGTNAYPCQRSLLESKPALEIGPLHVPSANVRIQSACAAS